MSSGSKSVRIRQTRVIRGLLIQRVGLPRSHRPRMTLIRRIYTDTHLEDLWRPRYEWFLARSSLWASFAAEKTRADCRRGDHIGAWHQREHCNLQRGVRDDSAAFAVRRA